MAPGERTTLAGKTPDIQDILEEPAFSTWELPLLRENDIRYVVADRRELSSETLRGYFFTTRGELGAEQLLPKAALTKFNTIPDAAKIYSSGSIVVYDLEAGK